MLELGLIGPAKPVLWCLEVGCLELSALRPGGERLRRALTKNPLSINPQSSTNTSATRDERCVVVPFQNSAPVAKIKKSVFIRSLVVQKTYFLKKRTQFHPAFTAFFKNHTPKRSQYRTHFSR